MIKGNGIEIEDYYTKAFRQQALEKVYNRGDRTVQAIAEDLNLNTWTLKR